MAYRLIALDIDGTLTNDEKEITHRTRETLIRLQEGGMRLALASARPTRGLYRCRDLLEMPKHSGMLMAYNGGMITDAGGKVLASMSIPQETARGILRFLKTQPVTVILDDGDRFCVEDAHGYKVEYECRNNGMPCEVKTDLAEFLCFAPCKLLLSVEPALLRSVQSAIAAYLPQELTVVRTADFYLEIILRAVNKGLGLEAVCRAAGIAPEEAIAFGDSENDIPMLRAAGIGVAMGNAEPEVKAAADLVTLSNNEDGIAAALESILK